jgi:hypothetical protein
MTRRRMGVNGDRASSAVSGVTFAGRSDATVRSRALSLRGGEAGDVDPLLRCLAGQRQTQIRRRSTHRAVRTQHFSDFCAKST